MSMFMGGSWAGKRMGFWLMATGVFEIAFGAFFFFMGQANPLLKGGFTITALLLAGLGVLCMLWGRAVRRKGAQTDHLKQMGIPGQADVVGLRQTGVVMNEINPQVEFTLNVRLSDGRAPYQVTLKDFVPGMMLGRMSNGAPLPVRVDPMNPQNVVILWEESLMAPGTGGAMGQPTVAGVAVGGTPDMSDPTEMADQAALNQIRAAGVVMPQMTSDQFDQVIAAQRERIRAGGVSATATIRSAKDMGQNLNDRRLFQLETEITPSDGRPAYRLAQPAAVPQHVADRIAKGFTAPAMVDATDPNLVVIEWDQGMAP